MAAPGQGLVIHHAGVIIYANLVALRLFRAERSDSLIGIPAIDRVDQEHKAQAAHRIEQGASKPNEAIIERLVTMDGESFPAEVQTRPVSFGSFECVLVTFDDLSEKTWPPKRNTHTHTHTHSKNPAWKSAPDRSLAN